MLVQKRLARTLAIVAGASMFALIGPATAAVEEPAVDPSPAPSYSGDNGAAGENCVIVVRPEKTLKNGKVLPAQTRISEACAQERTQVREESAQIREERAELREERAELRDEIREAGGAWGAYVRQETLVKVATRLAERNGQAPESAALGQILTLINYGLPEQFQFDVEAFCAQYELIFADLIKPSGDDEAEPEPSPSISPEPVE